MPRRASESVGEPASLALSLDALIALRHQPAMGTAPPEGRGPWAGAFRAATRGQGLEVDDLRPYLPGDDLRHVDWKTSARLGEPHTRLYREERDHALSVVLDLRDTMFTGSTRLRATEAALQGLRSVWRAVASGSRVSLVVLDADGVHLSDPARGERGALNACALARDRHAQRLAAIAVTMASAGDSSAGTLAPALSVLVDRLLGDGRRRGSVQLFSGLDDALLDGDSQRAFGEEMRRLALAGPVGVTLVEDALEAMPLPAGTYRYRGRTNGERVVVTGRTRHAILDRLQTRRQALATVCRQRGVAFELSPARPAGGR